MWNVEGLERRRLLSASLLKDVNPATPGNSAAAFADLNGVLVFSARAAEGLGLYRSDGTPAGTSKILPIVGGADGFSPVFNGALYFRADLGDGTGTELWRTDGTAAGTTRVKDVNPGAAASSPGGFRVVGGELWFSALHATHGFSLWKTDGTDAGTTLLYDPDPANQSVNLQDLEVIGDTVYFSTYRGLDAPVLWKSNLGFTSVQQIKSFRTDSSVDNLTPIGDRLLFSATPPGPPYTGNPELWVTDGTAANTRPLRGATTASPIRLPLDFEAVGDKVYFTAFNETTGREVYRTDGTEAGTVLVRDLWPGTRVTDFGPSDLTVHQGLLYFNGNDGTGAGLWRTDGTEAGTTSLTRAPIEDIVSSGGTVFFNTRLLGTWRTEGIWKSDGTPAGTVLVRPFARGLPLNVAPFKGGVAFTADDGMHGYEPWFSNGTPEGTVLLADLDARGASSGPPGMTVSLRDRTIFTAGDESSPTTGGPYPLWVTDGSAAGTTRIAQLPRAVSSRSATAVLNGIAYFAEDPQSGSGRLWRSDGTAEGTRLVAPTVRVESFSIAELNGALYFIGRLDGENSPGLFRTDGTPEGTVRVAGLPQSPGGYPYMLTAVGDTLYFLTASGFQAQARPQLWRSDGTGAGTSQVLEFSADDTLYMNPSALVNAGGKLFIVFGNAIGAAGRGGLWTSDGTAAGTVLLKRLVTSIDPFGPNTTQFATRGTDLFIAGAPENQEGGTELWKSDGTVAGTVRVKDINPGGVSSSPQYLRAAGNNVYFSANVAGAGRELWVTDGTEAGTRQVTDLRLGAGGSDPTVWGAVGGRVYFTATDGVTGRELWSTDGTAAGTSLVQDINPGAAGSNASVPRPFARPGGGLLLWADDGVRGSEPWTLPLAPEEPDTWLVGRHVFYNNSKFDGRNPAATTADDQALATDKRALRPGGSFSFENVTSYSRGINGIMADVSTRFDFFSDVRFSFKVGNDDSPADWAAAPVPLSVSRRNDGLPEDIDRFTIVWADGAIRNTWLQVTAEALLGDRVVATDVFYYGNLAGETGDPLAAGRAMRVSAVDVVRTRAAQGGRGAAVTSAFDHNRDGFINAADLAVARANQNAALNAPTIPDASPVAASGAAERVRTRRRAALDVL